MKTVITAMGPFERSERSIRIRILDVALVPPSLSVTSIRME